MKTKLYLIGLMALPLALKAQNTCATSQPVSAGTYTVAAVDGTDLPTTSCANGGLDGVTAGEWYIYTPTDNYSVTVTTDLPGTGAGTDTRFHVYIGACGALTCYSGNDDSGGGVHSTATFTVTSGTPYIILFDNKYSSVGFDFSITEDPIVVAPTPPVTFTGNFFPVISGQYSYGVVDMNGDFLDDIVTVSGSDIQILYQQVSGAFQTATYPTTNVTFLPSWSLAIADIDKNGFNDLLYGDGSGVTFMRANATGTGYTASSGSEYVFSQRSNFVDINNDGHLDAFVCHDVDPNVYYLNDGTGNLVYQQGGLGDHPEGGNYGSIWVDYDNDGDQDLFIAKCRGGLSTAKINELHRNDGNGVFTDVSVASNMADPIQTWSSAWNDFDNDGFLDAVVGASSTADGPHKVMHNNGDGTFSDVTAGSGWDTNPSLNIEHVSFDFDNDGFTDVLGGGNKISFGNGDMTFTSYVFDFHDGQIGDLNNDGFLDVKNGSNVYLSNGNDNNWVKVNLQGIASNSNGIGARVEIYGAWGKQIRNVQSGNGFRFMNTMNAHFGIGAATAIDSIIVKWPSGTVDINVGTPINGAITFVEGTAPLSLVELDGKNITLFPNPTTDYIEIDNIELMNVEEITVVSHTGSEVLKLKGSASKINVSSLVSGQYILIITTKENAKYSESFIKK